MASEIPTKGISLDELESNEQLLSRTNYLLAIGIDDYKYLPKLYNCAKDVNDLIAVLTERYLFEKENITTIFNQQATRSNISRELRNLATKITADDNLLIYFSGHGEYDKVLEQGYWIPIDAKQGQHSDYIPGSDLRVYLNAIKSHHTFLISDSCFSGALFSRETGKNISKRYENDASRWGLTAGRNEVVSDGKPGDNSPFAEGLLHRLRSNRHPMGVLELCFHVTEYVSRNATTKQSPIGQPMNVTGHKNGQFVFRLRENVVGKEWEKANEAHTAAAYATFIKNFPNSKFSGEAKKRQELLATDVSWDEIKNLPEGTYEEVSKKLFFVKEYIDRFKTAGNRDFALKLKKFLEEKEDRLRPDKSPPTIPPSPPPVDSSSPSSIFAESLRAFILKHVKPILITAGILGAITAGVVAYNNYQIEQAAERKRKVEELKRDIAWNRIKDQNNIDSLQWFLDEFSSGKFNEEASSKIEILAQKTEEEIKSMSLFKPVKKNAASEKTTGGKSFYDQMTEISKIEPALLMGQVDQQPIFAGCEKVILSKKCSDDQLEKFIKDNIKNPRLFTLSSLKSNKKTVYANFIIEEDGNVSNIFTSGKDKNMFQEEVKRVINLMPKWTPAKKDGKPVRMNMSIPITFKTPE